MCLAELAFLCSGPWVISLFSKSHIMLRSCPRTCIFWVIKFTFPERLIWSELYMTSIICVTLTFLSIRLWHQNPWNRAKEIAQLIMHLPDKSEGFCLNPRHLCKCWYAYQHTCNPSAWEACWCTKEFYNNLEYSITKVYLVGNKLTERVMILSALCVLGTGTESSSQEACACFSSAFIVHKTTPKVGWYLKGYWLKEFPQQ